MQYPPPTPAQLHAYRLQQDPQYRDIYTRLIRKTRGEWVVKGVIFLVIATVVAGGVYAVSGPQKWSPALTFIFITFAGGWWRADPRPGVERNFVSTFSRMDNATLMGHVGRLL